MRLDFNVIVGWQLGISICPNARLDRPRCRAQCNPLSLQGNPFEDCECNMRNVQERSQFGTNFLSERCSIMELLNSLASRVVQHHACVPMHAKCQARLCIRLLLASLLASRSTHGCCENQVQSRSTPAVALPYLTYANMLALCPSLNRHPQYALCRQAAA